MNDKKVQCLNCGEQFEDFSRKASPEPYKTCLHCGTPFNISDKNIILRFKITPQNNESPINSSDIVKELDKGSILRRCKGFLTDTSLDGVITFSVSRDGIEVLKDGIKKIEEERKFKVDWYCGLRK
jgi:predicted  nucleic acid-binding Zn-ribbon protein